MLSIKKSSVLGLGAVLALTLSACGGNDTETTGAPATGGAATSAAPKSSPSPVAEIDKLTGVSTAVKLDPMFVAGLGQLMLTPGTIGGAKLDMGTGTVSFPITGGNVTYFDPKSGVEPYVQGEILHDGSGLSLTGGGKKVELTDFTVDPGESVLTGKVTVDGKVAFESAELFFLDGSTLQPLKMGENGTAILQGTTVSLTKDAADALNMVFGVDALTEFFPVGTATITVNTK